MLGDKVLDLVGLRAAKCVFGVLVADYDWCSFPALDSRQGEHTFIDRCFFVFQAVFVEGCLNPAALRAKVFCIYSYCHCLYSFQVVFRTGLRWTGRTAAVVRFAMPAAFARRPRPRSG